jgi:hypothetical protein
MVWETLVVVALTAAVLIYALRHLPKAIKNLKKELRK